LTTPHAREAAVHVVINGKPEVLDVTFVDLNYGGRGQPYFRCMTCLRRVQHLYLYLRGDGDLRSDGERLTCRRCARLTSIRFTTRGGAVSRAGSIFSPACFFFRTGRAATYAEIIASAAAHLKKNPLSQFGLLFHECTPAIVG
jgi:hypothetical protein